MKKSASMPGIANMKGSEIDRLCHFHTSSLGQGLAHVLDMKAYHLGWGDDKEVCGLGRMDMVFRTIAGYHNMGRLAWENSVAEAAEWDDEPGPLGAERVETRVAEGLVYIVVDQTCRQDYPAMPVESRICEAYQPRAVK